MTLRIIAAEEQLRTLKLSVQTLSKFGAETIIEARPGCLHLRSVNESRSAYVRLTFSSACFDVYELFEQPVLSASILSKSLVASLKTQRICRAIFEIFSRENKMVVFIDCENGLQNKFEFDLIDSDALHAEINFDLYPVRIAVETGELSRLLSSFQQTLDEVTMIAIPDSIDDCAAEEKSCQLHSFYDPLKVDLDNSLLHTQLALNAHQHFLEYQHSGRETVDVTFNLKDLKVVLGYASATRNNVRILFSKAGEPLAILPIPANEHMNMGISAEFVLATMLDSCVDSNGRAALLLNKAPVNANNRASVLPERYSMRNSMDTNEVAKNLVAMNNAQQQHDSQSLVYPSGNNPPSKRLRPTQDTSATVSMNCDHHHHNNNNSNARNNLDYQDDEDDDEVPGTPPHERRMDTWIQNWS